MEKAWNAEIVNDKGFKKDLPPKLSIPQQVDNMKEKGIKFEIMSEADARRFLSGFVNKDREKSKLFL